MANIKQLCRACLATKESFTHFLFENVTPEIYFFCTSIQVTQNENLPRALCNSCYSLLTNYSEFKRTCIESQDTLISFQNGAIHAEETKLLENKQEYDIIVKTENEAHNYNDDVADTHLSADEIEAESNTMENRLKKRRKKLVKLKGQRKKVQSKIQKRKFNYTCDICSKKFSYQETFEAHKQLHEGKITVISCIPCNKTFTTWSGLKKHRDSEHTQVKLKSLKCTQCGKIFKNKQTLKYHQKTHSERSMCVCDVCGKEFISAVVLKTHLETHNENRERPFSCEHCGKKFFTNNSLLTHVSRLHTNRRFYCEFCNFPFTDKYNLAKHLLRHNGINRHKCDICHKCYASQATLVIHKRIHSGERPFACSLCPKAFISKKRLTEHHRTHTGDRPHKCNVCSQSFTQRGSLKRHMKVHDKLLMR